jgi:hypothetical protein
MATQTNRLVAAGFNPGDVVIRLRTGVSVAANATIASGRLGTICRVVNANRSYMVRYADLAFCVLAFQSSLALAPVGSIGPECETDC